jgi:IS605 OrfB family transposase
MFRTVKVKLLGNPTPLVATAKAFNEACQKVLDYGYRTATYNKSKLNKATYHQIRSVSTLPSALVQTARDEASEMLKRLKFKVEPKKKRLSIRYDGRTFKFYADSGYISLTTVMGRLTYPFKKYAYMDKYRGEYTNAQLVIRHGVAFLNVQVKMPDTPTLAKREPAVLGVDRGVLNIATCSDNTFFNSKKLRNVKGRFQHLKSKLQHLGTRSAKRKLKRLSGRERRFVRDVNHVISKRTVNKPFNVIALEKLEIEKTKKNGRRFNRKLGSWSYNQLSAFIKYKAESTGKTVVEVNPRHTSQTCSICGYTDKSNRKGLVFKCRGCGYELNADLNAARNIAVLGMSEYGRLCVNEPNVASQDSYKPPNLLGGS